VTMENEQSNSPAAAGYPDANYAGFHPVYHVGYGHHVGWGGWLLPFTAGYLLGGTTYYPYEAYYGCPAYPDYPDYPLYLSYPGYDYPYGGYPTVTTTPVTVTTTP
jgi:hypothetical protein